MEKENKRLGMTHDKSAIAIVQDYDLPITPQEYTQEIMPMYYEKWLKAKPLPGVNRLIKHLLKLGIPFSVASNSARKHVAAKVNAQKGWKDYFSVVLGSDDVKLGKPAPDLFLEAASRMGVDASCCLVIEDSITGVKAGKAANMKVVAVPSIEGESDEFSIADYVMHSLLDLQPELCGLPPFDDWVMNALPIQPIHFKGSYKNGFIQEISDNGHSDLPSQAWGVYFGWADFESQERIKIVVSTRWDRIHGSFARNIQACFLNGNAARIYDQPMEVALVGYIRGFHTMQNLATDAQILDQDKSTAEACLDVAAYSYHGRSTS
ncbi:cof protein [Artemisia annua]|uniref:riboflavin kinase n=1 Tax=Artemisia annua TaxID=35608 RepID=A0A2U1L4D0_ARTAN|nr:cof protein [Artemisia annua]